MGQESSGGPCIESFLDRISDPAAFFWRSLVTNSSAGLNQTFPWIDPDSGQRIKKELLFY
jgi:hypothetical protein